ncbi:MAG: acyl carrier protein [Methyloceanibacter sp.]
MEHDTRKFRGQKRPGQTGAPAQAARPRPASGEATTLAAVIAEVLPRFDAQTPPQASAELYADLLIDSRRFLMIIRGLERNLNLEIDDEDLLGVDLITYGDLVKFVDRISAKASAKANG